MTTQTLRRPRRRPAAPVRPLETRIGPPDPSARPSDALPSDRAERIERAVHEAMLTARTFAARDTWSKPTRSTYWPSYLYETSDHGDRVDLGTLRGLSAPWRPNARHIDEMEWIFIDCFGKWENPRSGRNGPERWQWIILELRAWQTVFRWKGGWRAISEQLSNRPNMPSFSHSWCKVEHDRLIRIAIEAADRDGRF